MTKSTIPAEKVRFFSGSSNPALAASIAAVIFIWSWRAFDGKVGATFTALREKPQTLHLLALGALVGPLLGVSASLLAVQHAEVGVASTLMAYTKAIHFSVELPS